MSKFLVFRSDVVIACFCLGIVINYFDQERLLEFVVFVLNIKFGYIRVFIVGSIWKWYYKIVLYLRDLIVLDDIVLVGGFFLLFVFLDCKLFF